GQQVLVPSRALAEVTRLLGEDTGELTIRLGERDASFEVGDVHITTRLIEGDFPNYQGLIPSGHANRLTIGREPLIEAVRRVKLMAREATPVRLVMQDGELELIATTQDVGEAQDAVDAKYEGEELTVAFNPDYLLNGAEVSEGDEVTIETIDSLKPVLMRSEAGSDFLYLLMPVRVS
ncbi:MAG: DNA polymerase III subunit beta, partial [Actinomycetota bacterium]